MIQNDNELQGTLKRIAQFLELLVQIRANAPPHDVALMAGGYRAEVERMQKEVLDYLTQPLERASA